MRWLDEYGLKHMVHLKVHQIILNNQSHMFTGIAPEQNTLRPTWKGACRSFSSRIPEGISGWVPLQSEAGFADSKLKWDTYEKRHYYQFDGERAPYRHS
jgi:hypothetical protein